MGRKNKKTAMKQRNLLMAVIRETLNEGVPILTHPHRAYLVVSEDIL
jgi:hypothetical protein